MIFSVLILIFVLTIAYFHWVQGLFTAAMSMTLAILAGTFALGMHETIVNALLGGKAADLANAMVICLLFGVIYGVGRLIFDGYVPGNIRLPLYVDKVGGAVCGFIAGIFAVGTFAVAAQQMPFGPTIGMFSRYTLAEPKDVVIAGERRAQDVQVRDALEDDLPDAEKENSLILPVDQWLTSYVGFQSEAGTLAGGTSFKKIHPEYLRSLFFSRTGIEPGAKHVAMNISGKTEVAVPSLYAPAALPQMDGELSAVRIGSRKVASQVKADANNVILVIRTTVKRSATETDSKFRFSPGMVRLVSDEKVHYPVGTLYHPGNILLANRIDDYLIAELAGDVTTIDLVFTLPRSEILEDPSAKEGLKIKNNAFVEVKRYGRVDLSDMKVDSALPPALTSGTVVRKKGVVENINKGVSEGTAGGATP